MPARPKPITRLLYDLEQGAYDNDLNQIVEVINKKVALGYIRTRWLIDVAGVHVAEDDMTVDEVWQIEQALDMDWTELTPYTMSGTERRAVMLVFLQTRAGLTLAEAEEKMKHITAVALARGMTNDIVPGDDDEGRVPLDSAVPATT